MAAALLTPGLIDPAGGGGNLPASCSRLVCEQGGADSHSRFRTAVLLLEMLDAVSGGGDDSSGSRQASDESSSRQLECVQELQPLLLQLAVGALQQVASPLEQLLLQQLLAGSPRLAR